MTFEPIHRLPYPGNPDVTPLPRYTKRALLFLGVAVILAVLGFALLMVALMGSDYKTMVDAYKDGHFEGFYAGVAVMVLAGVSAVVSGVYAFVPARLFWRGERSRSSWVGAGMFLSLTFLTVIVCIPSVVGVWLKLRELAAG